MEDFTVYQKRWKMTLFCIVCLIFALMGLVVLLSTLSGEVPDFNAHKIWFSVLGLSLSIICGLCFIYFLKRMIKPRPAIIVSTEGLTDHSSFIGAGFTKWEDIAKIGYVDFASQQFLGIFTHDEDLIINRFTGIKRWMIQINTKLLPSQINIKVQDLNCTEKEFLKEVEAHWKYSTQHRANV